MKINRLLAHTFLSWLVILLILLIGGWKALLPFICGACLALMYDRLESDSGGEA